MQPSQTGSHQHNQKSRNFPTMKMNFFFERRNLPLQPSTFLPPSPSFTHSLNLWENFLKFVEWVQGKEKTEKKELSLFNLLTLFCDLYHQHFLFRWFPSSKQTVCVHHSFYLHVRCHFSRLIFGYYSYSYIPNFFFEENYIFLFLNLEYADIQLEKRSRIQIFPILFSSYNSVQSN